MPFRLSPFAIGGALLALLALLVLIGTLNGFRFLWVFPLDGAGLPLWMLLTAADILLADVWPAPRPLLWCGGILLFTARQGVPEAGVGLLVGAVALWLGQKLQSRAFPWAVGLVVSLAFAFGHDSALSHPGMLARLGDWRFSCHLLASFALFRALSWTVAVKARGARPSFVGTLEYFLAPAFWLSPLHAAHLLWDKMDGPPVPRTHALGWVARGFLHALLFSVFLGFVIPWLEARFGGGVSSFRWWDWLLVGPALFVVTYLEKSRVTYVVAGTLSLTGHGVAPDFHEPWRARDLPEYWRRFHSWLWEYYVDLLYLPLAAFLARYISPRAAARLTLFLTFAIGTSLIHWVHYPAPFLSALALGTLFGAATTLHAVLPLRRSRLGVPITWLTVFALYFLAYPAFGLGWGGAELLQFFRR